MYHPLNEQIFPFVSSFELFMKLVGDQDDVIITNEHGFKSISTATFDNVYAKECRGIVFNPDGMLVARPLHKLFNLNERDGVRPSDFDWSTLVRIMDQRDGSMIHTVNVGDQSPFRKSTSGEWTFDLKSKASFSSDVADAARKWMLSDGRGAYFIKFCQEMIDLDYTAIFEYTSPAALNVLPYQHDELTLLHVRDNMTGRYLPTGEIYAHAAGWNIMTVKNDLSGRDDLFEQMLAGDRSPTQVWTAVQRLIDEVEGVKGWVFQFMTGEMVKVQTKWYSERLSSVSATFENPLDLNAVFATLNARQADGPMVS